MNAQEFVQYMPVTALVDTLVVAWDTYDETDEALHVIRTCWAQLLRMRDPDDAIELIDSRLGNDLAEFLEVVS